MSEAERKSHIPDETLANLTGQKLIELEDERDALSDELFRAVQTGAKDSQESGKLERQIENHDAAADKLTRYRAEMLADANDEDE